MKKLSFLLAILLLLSVCFITACKEEHPEETTPQNATAEETTPGETTPGETTAPEPVQPVVHAKILIEQLANYEIVSAKSSSEETDKLTKELQQAVQNAFELPISLKTENAYNKTQYEILIGNTNREESQTFLSQMKYDDYGYAIVGDKLVIAGKNEDGTLMALRAFLEHVQKNDGEVFFTNKDQLLVKKQYPYPTISINGVAAEELSILCNEQSLGGVAQIIRDAIIRSCGIAVPIVTDRDVESLEKVILIGDTAHIDVDAAPDEIAYPTGREYYIDTFSCCAWLKAKTAAGYYSAAAYIESYILPNCKGGDNVVLANGAYEGEDAIAVMSFNLMAGKEDKRADSIVETILKYRPAVVGVQEATDNWMNILRGRLGDTYTIVGVGRNADGHDEHSAILYLTEEFNCLESGTKWLSDTPDIAGSKFESSHYTRIMTYVHLSRKSDGKQILHVNTHLDYTIKPEEQATQVAQMQVVLNEIAKFSGIPTIITGDFNADSNSQAYRAVLDAGYRATAEFLLSAERAPTYHALMGTTGEPSHIDFIFRKGMEYTYYYRICTERVNNENVSDHYPVLSVLTFSSTGK